VSASRQVISQTVRALAAIGLVVLATPQVAESQVGLTSGMARITLVARIPPSGSIQGVSAQRETGWTGTLREASVTVRISANAGYQLVVRGTGVPNSRTWVRAASGEFQELTAGSSVIVARGGRAAGQWEREVSYRIESAAKDGAVELPVRYEIVVTPTI
jgi:hypothetical protein